MENLISIENKNGQMVVSSREVAVNFRKQHKDVLESIEKLVQGVAEKSASLFIPSEYQHEQNKQWYKEYLLTRDGFSLLVMGFTGSKALEWKLRYIEAFNQMEQQLQKGMPLPTPVVSQADEIMAEVKLKNARMREANLLMKVAVHLDLMEQKQVYRKSAELLMGERLRQHDELQVLGRKLHYISTVDADQDALYACQELKSGVITVMVNARSFGEENDLRQKCMMMLEEQAPVGCLAEGIVVR